MRSTMAAVIIVLAAAMPAAAQEKTDNVLTPTDLLEIGQVSLTGGIRIAAGSAEMTSGPTAIDLDIDSRSYDLLFQGGVGLGKGFEIEVEIPYQIEGTSEGDGTIGAVPVELESKTYRFGDLTARCNYRIWKEDEAGAQWLAGVMLVMPVGFRKEAAAEIESSILTTDGEKGGTGEGVWKPGFGSAISKRFGMLEPYLGASYLFGGDTERKGVDYERPDVGQMFAGAEIHISPEMAFDVRGAVDFRGGSFKVDDGDRETVERHRTYGLSTLFYTRLVPGVTLAIGGAVYQSDDFLANKEDDIALEDVVTYFLQGGVQIVLGGN